MEVSLLAARTGLKGLGSSSGQQHGDQPAQISGLCVSEVTFFFFNKMLVQIKNALKLTVDYMIHIELIYWNIEIKQKLKYAFILKVFTIQYNSSHSLFCFKLTHSMGDIYIYHALKSNTRLYVITCLADYNSTTFISKAVNHISFQFPKSRLNIFLLCLLLPKLSQK